jgi:hypothetical protein
VPGGDQQGVHRITRGSEQVIASKSPILFHMPDHRLDS